MNEVRAIVEAFDATNAASERCALATLVNVEGSSYRRPGAHMLIREDGSSTGTISAGCLENDLIEHALLVLSSGKAKLVEYNTASTSDEAAWGLGLGCDGIVRVLVEPLNTNSLYIQALRDSCGAQPNNTTTIVATVYRGTKIGGRVYLDGNGQARHERLSYDCAQLLENEIRTRVLQEVTSTSFSFEVASSTAEVFIETLQPPVPLVVFGAGYDVLPVIEVARSLGWRTEVIDPQARPASQTRFATADRVILARPEEAGAHVTITPRTMTLLMSHNYTHDLAMLRFLLSTPACYIGIMGPRKRTERMLRELMSDETFTVEKADMARLYSPAGLDIGANGPAEIALSIVAEMRAVLAGRRGGMLRERRSPIHSDDEAVA